LQLPYSITLFGIPNCDTVKKARAWLAEHQVTVQFHDFKKLGVPPELLDHWLSTVGWEKLLNRQGTTWRQLDEASKASVHDSKSARSLMLAQPSVIKRPVVAWSAQDLTVGFDAANWQSRLP